MAVPGQRNPHICLPHDLYATRLNSAGLDLSDEGTLATLGDALRAAGPWRAGMDGSPRPILNPADHRDRVGTVIEASVMQAQAAARVAQAAASGWAAVPPTERAAVLERAADAMQATMPELLALIVREAGKSLPNAIAELREAIDFLRYYAQQARTTLGDGHRPLGVVTCIVRGIFRWRSSSARSRRRWSRAMPCSPSRRRKRP
jgi:RHH-type proline utilization regulon transcriptional repressor/proline dehydrogenase/delta 1-pyrroline-5-carboxylate dehydrogenase